MESHFLTEAVPWKCISPRRCNGKCPQSRNRTTVPLLLPRLRDLSTDNDDVPGERLVGGGLVLAVEVSSSHHEDPGGDDSNTGPLVTLHPPLQDQPGGQADEYYDGASQHLELGGAGEIEAEQGHGGDQEVAEGRREEEEGRRGGLLVLSSAGGTVMNQ